jgi:hypothetical protein
LSLQDIATYAIVSIRSWTDYPSNITILVVDDVLSHLG